jgi:mannosyltransferase OCH1-like enzyme
MIALRRAGHLGRERMSYAVLSAIPRRIAQYWHAGAPPEDVKALMATWPQQNPGHRHLLFGDEAAKAFLSEHLGPEVLAAYQRAEHPTQKSDIFRLAWLYAEGGWYVDCDDRCHAPLEGLARTGALLILHQEELGSLCNNIVGAVRLHPVIGGALRGAVAAVNAADSDYLWLATGPAP